MSFFRQMLVFVLGFAACCSDLRADEIDYGRDIKPLLKSHCWACHGALKQEGGLRLDTGALVRRGGESGRAIVPGDAARSLLLQRVAADDDALRMPPDGDRLSAAQVARLRQWVAAGAVSPADEAAQPDPHQHWAFRPVVETEFAGVTHPSAIDSFVKRRLDDAGLAMSHPADRVTLARRLYYDLIGLPPTPQQLQQFADETAPDAYERLVDRTLASPRYGERWGQHWLDIVRYADTHGYEVNTPRPNAWPYRDYVIRALNHDKPYDQFVLEQLAGDAVGAGAGTGFLVAAAALLPGQIGADEASKRLARQDALDEIIVGTSATFLGLTVGCARCHDHKFDPISQRDYYALQAFFAGVRYGERKIEDEDRADRLAQAERLQPALGRLRSKLHALTPPAFVGRTIVIDDEDASRVTHYKQKQGHGSNPPGTQRGYLNDLGTGERFGNLSRGKYTWWANVPGEDVFSYQPGVAGRFQLWISWGVHGSGVHTRDARYVIDQDGQLETREDQRELARVDQYYFAGVSEGESEKKPLWSGLLHVGEVDLQVNSKIVLRGGDTKTGITADVIVLQEAGNAARSLPQLRGPVNAKHNDEYFQPRLAKYIRFTSLATNENNRYEPCLDELQVFAAKTGKNVALASLGTKATSSGNYGNAGKHQLPHINDGRFGNSYSWISNERGKGWVQLELAQPTMIERIAWGRDRDGKFADRLATNYRIDVATELGEWTTVAQSQDRVPMGTPHDEVTSILRNSSGTGGQELKRTISEVQRLEHEQQTLRVERVGFVGQFSQPDQTRLLRRGDPEQPGDVVAPQTLSLFQPPLKIDSNEEQARRVALARWITDSEHVLTARVMVNRIWQYHFGRGLVETASDFGMNGALPSHPQLLDWLTTEFVGDGWSIKRMHQRIVQSATYRQSHQVDLQGQAVDADCRLLWRFPTRRVEAEVIRDSMLAVSGQLSLHAGGPGFDFFKTRGGLTGFPPLETFGPRELRRMIYAHKIRMEPVPVFGAFDCPDAGQATPRRSQSTTAIQALNLFNSPFVIEQAEALARRLQADVQDDPSRQVQRAYELVLGRPPTAQESTASVHVVHDHGLATLCRVLFNSNEFLFIP